MHKKILGYLAIVLALLLGNSHLGEAFTTADLEGTWFAHVLNADTISPGWAYAKLSVDSNGVATTMSYMNSEGDTDVNNFFGGAQGGLSIASDGTFLNMPSGHGIINSSKNMVTWVIDDGGGGYDLLVFTKMEGTFSAADLEGTWFAHVLNADTISPGWAYAKLSVDSNGVATTMSYMNSEGDTDVNNFFGGAQGGLSIASDGTFLNMPSGHGIINSSKNMVTWVIDDGGGGYDLVVMVKGGGTFTTADLEGTWYIHGLTSGDAPQWTGWFYATLSADSSGNLTWISRMNSDGDTDVPSGGNVNIAGDGIITGLDAPSFHGIMNLEKDMIVFTMDDGGGGYDLVVMVKGGGEEQQEGADEGAEVTEAEDGGGGTCFIATAAYGTPLASEVRTLSKFRDKILLKSGLGRQLVKAYYTLSPPCAKFIARHPVLRAIARAQLKPIVKISRILAEE